MRTTRLTSQSVVPAPKPDMQPATTHALSLLHKHAWAPQTKGQKETWGSEVSRSKDAKATEMEGGNTHKKKVKRQKHIKDKRQRAALQVPSQVYLVPRIPVAQPNPRLIFFFYNARFVEILKVLLLALSKVKRSNASCENFSRKYIWRYVVTTLGGASNS